MQKTLVQVPKMLHFMEKKNKIHVYFVFPFMFYKCVPIQAFSAYSFSEGQQIGNAK